MRQSNPFSTEFGIQRLNLQESDVFLELGAGEGAGIKAIQTVPSRILLVEISEQFREILTNVKDELPFKEKVEIHSEDCKHMPFLDDNSVDKIFSMNVVYFLNPLPEYLQELHRVLKPRGSVVFGCKFKLLPKDSDVFVNVEEEKIVDMMKAASFEVSSEFVEVSKEDARKNYLEIKGIKKDL